MQAGNRARTSREARRDRSGRCDHLALSESGENAPGGHQPQSSALVTSRAPSDQGDKGMLLGPKEVRGRTRECGHGSDTFLLLQSEVTRLFPAHTHLDAISERSQEPGGSLNFPTLTVAVIERDWVNGWD